MTWLSFNPIIGGKNPLKQEVTKMIAKNPKSNAQRYIILIFIALAGGVMTKLPYLGDTYFIALEKATGATRTQMGLLWSAYGFVNFLTYFPGGVLADKFSSKKLVLLACFGTAAIGVWYAALPSFVWLVVIHCALAITTVFVFWAAMEKTVMMQGGKDEQGKLFGFFEGTRALVGMVAIFVSVLVFNQFADEVAGFRGVILYYSFLLALAGVLIALFLRDPSADEKAMAGLTGEKKKEKYNKKEVIALLKYPQIWMCGLIAFCSYGSNCFASYINPYFVEAFGASSSIAAVLTTIRSTVMCVIGSYLAGILADKMGSRVKYMGINFIGMTVTSLLLILAPANKTGFYMFFASSVVLGFCAYSVKSLYFATIKDVGIPHRLAGTGAGIVSLVGYAPEMFVYIIIGQIMDKVDKFVGYRINFMCMVGCGLAGVICSLILMHQIKFSKQLEITDDPEMV